MDSIYLSFNLKSIASSIETTDKLDKNYQLVYKPIAKFLYTHPDFNFSFSFTGNQLTFFKKRRAEFISILKQLSDRKQIEILGGGFYDPVLPLLYPADRSGQIDMLSAEIRQTMGKRPRGITLFDDCWDSSLVNTLQTCGIEYVLLDNYLIPSDKNRFLPLIMSNLGKSIQIFPYYDNFIPDSNEDIESFLNKISRFNDKILKKEENFYKDSNRIVNININHAQLIELLNNKWFEKLDSYLKNHEEINFKTITPVKYKGLNYQSVSAYIPAGINHSIAKWIASAYKEIEPKNNICYTAHDFMDTYPHSHSLYNRILYVSMLVNQYKNDKMRKKAAREKLWQAQNGTGLLCSSKGAFSNSKYRQQSYKYLMESEKILREDSSFKETITNFDYNCDGLNEYVCRMNNYFSYITLISGAVQELDILKNTGNYVDNLSRINEYDKCVDNYERGIFIDHLFTESQIEKYKKGKPTGDGVFSKIQYEQIKYSSSHHEILLEANAVFQPAKQSVTLRKKYIINSTGMIVQYILRNNSDKKLNAYFAVEANIAHTNFSPENITYYNLEAVKDDKVFNIDTSKENQEDNSGIELVRITDKENGISFGFEPNENCNFVYYPLIFNRPSFDSNELTPVSMTFVNTLFWNVAIEPGKEIEKTINFTITNVKKEKPKK